MTTRLPEFKKPPLSEVAMGIFFDPLQRWNPAHAGFFWSKFQEEYPEVEIQTPLETQIERFGDDRWAIPGIQIAPIEPDQTRFWFLTTDKTRLIQLQRNAFIVNWRRVTGAEEYPRYEKEMRERLAREWEVYRKFVAEHNLGDIKVTQCELTYVNDLFQGHEWQKLPEALDLFSSFWKPSDAVPVPDSFNIAVAFERAEEATRLRVECRHVKRSDSGKEAFQFRLIARGAPKDGSTEGILAWMDRGRDWIVRTFTDLTSDRAHKIWERT